MEPDTGRSATSDLFQQLRAAAKLCVAWATCASRIPAFAAMTSAKRKGSRPAESLELTKTQALMAVMATAQAAAPMRLKLMVDLLMSFTLMWLSKWLAMISGHLQWGYLAAANQLFVVQKVTAKEPRNPPCDISPGACYELNVCDAAGK
jgi:hypothetical protein